MLGRFGNESIAHRLHLHPSVLLVGSFAMAILAGAGILMLPASRTAPLSFVDALFTSTSAVCVTGLTVVDVGTAFTPLGQAALLGLIQAGGLGIMTFAVFFSMLLGRRITFSDRMVLEDSLHHSPTRALRKLLAWIVLSTLAIEALGAAALWARWRFRMSGPQALWNAVFHSVSAFCNAGFSTLPRGLMDDRGDWVVNLAITGLVVVGGLGFIVNMEVGDRFLDKALGRGRVPFSLHTKLVLSVTGVLLLLGTVGFLVLEWGNLLSGMSFGEKLLVSWFASVTPRTAGFNTVDYGLATTAALMLTMGLMFVGASPGSTGGGIKTTTAGLLVLLFRARWGGRGRPTAFHRAIPHAVMDRALSVAVLSPVLLSLALLAMVVFEQGATAHGLGEPRFLRLFFEAVSAFGTVGLSTGITPTLVPGTKLVLVLLMFVGRVGPLTIALAAGRKHGRGRFKYAEENVMVG